MHHSKIRVLIAKVGLDGHERGARIIAHALEKAGMEVIYLGIRQTPKQVVEVAIDEDVNVIGVSCLSGAHIVLFTSLTNLLRKKGIKNILLIGGGIIPKEDIPSLKKAGFSEIFGPGTFTDDIIKFIFEHTQKTEFMRIGS
jgi:methylmalonyl-CoA mutase C-terminal domain/subunit